MCGITTSTPPFPACARHASLARLLPTPLFCVISSCVGFPGVGESSPPHLALSILCFLCTSGCCRLLCGRPHQPGDSALHIPSPAGAGPVPGDHQLCEGSCAGEGWEFVGAGNDRCRQERRNNKQMDCMGVSTTPPIPAFLTLLNPASDLWRGPFEQGRT